MNIDFHIAMKENPEDIYEMLADHMITLGLGTIITNNELCLLAGFNPEENIESGMLASAITTKLRVGIDRWFAARDMDIGFARQTNIHKKLCEHHLLEGTELHMDQALHLTARMIRTTAAWAQKTNQIFIEHKHSLNRGQKYTFKKILKMAENSRTRLESEASAEVLKIIAQDPSFAPLEHLVMMLQEGDAEMGS